MNLLSLVPLPYRILALAVIAFALIAFGWVHGNAHGTQKLIDYQAAEAANEVRIAKAREVVTTQVVTKYVQVAAKTEVITQTVEKEVVKYAETNATSCLDVPWRRLHDAAALNRLPDPRPPVDGALQTPSADAGANWPVSSERGAGAQDGNGELRAASSLRGPD